MKKLIYIVAGIIVLIIVIIIIGSNGEKKQTESEQQIPKQIQQEIQLPDKHFLNFDINLDGRNLTINGNTNIPNDSVLNISIYRYVEYKTLEDSLFAPSDMEGKRVVGLDDEDVVVNDGKFEYSTCLIDKEWYKKELEENERFGLDFKKIHDDCYASVTFTPKAKQPQEIYKVLGSNFEKLNVDIEEERSFKTIQISKEFKLLFEE